MHKLKFIAAVGGSVGVFAVRGYALSGNAAASVQRAGTTAYTLR